MKDIITILENRSSANSGGIDTQLCILAHKIIDLTDNHQKRVLKIMPEFDLHDGNHLKKVEGNIVLLMREDIIEKLSSLELFLLLMSVRLHDCGMAPADWELSLMSLTEGYNDYTINPNSLYHDGKKPLAIKEAKEFVETNKTLLYKNFESIKAWDFAPAEESSLISYLAELLVDYQEYRNGFIDEIKSVTDKYCYDKLNQSLRVDYIRLRHHKKSADYIRNLQGLFQTFLGENWPQRLLSDLAKVCQTHGENIKEVRGLKTSVKYVDSSEVNLQFIAMMLRLGDIIHYSSDRAPAVLRNAIDFKSEFSKHEWLTKIGLNYTIQNGTVSYMANCQVPDDYYHLQEYLNWVDQEIDNLDLLKRNWSPKYKLEIQEVDRNNVEYDETKFKPVIGKKFTLSQNKIIELLMGVKLYKNPYSCIRELYQNALDACRCRIAIAKINGQIMEGNIEFGIIDDIEGRYLYCKDNGLGMTEFVIENYLLKIGNSFYNSTDFYRKQSQWDCSYTPVSQFGIGILSCFIIGSKLEIITTSHESHKCIVCCIDGATENFYYRTPSKEEEESIRDSGTIVKILLRPDYANKININYINKLGLVLQYHYNEPLSGNFAIYNSMFENWNKHLYHYLNDFVTRVPDNITLNVRFSNNSIQKIFNKPFAINIGELGISEEDQPFIDRIISRGSFYSYNGSVVELQSSLKQYPIHVETDSLTYDTILALPLPGMKVIDDENLLFRLLRVEGAHVSVDGISIDDKSYVGDNYLSRLEINGCLNYIGEQRPQLSVDPREIVSYPDNYELKYKELTEKEIVATIEIARKHIEQYGLSQNVQVVNLIWRYIFQRLGCAQTIFVNKLANSELGNISWAPLSNLIGTHVCIRDIVTADIIKLNNYDHTQMDYLGKMIAMSLFMSAEKIEIINEHTIKIYRNKSIDIPESEEMLEHDRYLVPAEDSEVFSEYDIVSNLYPVVPKRLIQGLSRIKCKICDSHAIIVHAWGNCYNELFFQDARLVNPNIGLYRADDHFGRKPNHYIHAFDNLNNHFQCMDFVPDFQSKKFIVPVLAYIAPAQLTSKDVELLNALKNSEPEYYKGVIEGWTVLVTNMDIDNVVIKPGKVSRNSMVFALSDKFWHEYKDWTFQFLDGTRMLKPT